MLFLVSILTVVFFSFLSKAIFDLFHQRKILRSSREHHFAVMRLLMESQIRDLEESRKSLKRREQFCWEKEGF